jgi:hypothetical protein
MNVYKRSNLKNMKEKFLSRFSYIYNFLPNTNELTEDTKEEQKKR